MAFLLGAVASGAEPIRLMVRGDDFGYTHASNEALQQALRKGVMTSASILTPAPWFNETAAILREHPELSAGVHLTITSEWNRLRWRPLSGAAAVPSLAAPDGAFWGFGYGGPRPQDWPADGAPWATHDPNPSEVEREFRAQIERAKRAGLRIDYIDCHMGMACREDLLPITRKLAKEYCLGISGQFGEKRFAPEYGDRKPATVKAALLAAIDKLEPGLSLYVGHPAVDSPELRAVDTNSGESWALQRSSVLAAWTDPDVKRAIERRGIELVSIRDLFDHQACRPR